MWSVFTPRVNLQSQYIRILGNVIVQCRLEKHTSIIHYAEKYTYGFS